MQTTREWLDELVKDEPAVKWAKTQPDPQTLWDKCEYGDWMLEMVGVVTYGIRSKDRKKLVLATCECARLALPCVPEGEERPLHAIETAEAWARGEIASNILRKVNASISAYDKESINASWEKNIHDGASFAVTAARHASAAAYANSMEQCATCIISALMSAFEADNPELTVRRQIADIVRKYYPKVPKMPKPPLDRKSRQKSGISLYVGNAIYSY